MKRRELSPNLKRKVVLQAMRGNQAVRAIAALHGTKPPLQRLPRPKHLKGVRQVRGVAYGRRRDTVRVLWPRDAGLSAYEQPHR